MPADPLILDLTEELAQSWADKFTFLDIRSDVSKLELLMRVRDQIESQRLEPSETLRGFYTGVFLREQFSSPTPPKARRT